MSFPKWCDEFALLNASKYLQKILIEWFYAAIRTKPSDLRRWSEMYFRMKANDDPPPINPYLYVPDQISGRTGLTPNNLKALALTLVNELEPLAKIKEMWDILSLDNNTYLEIVQIGKFDDLVRPSEFIGIAAAYLHVRLRDTMILLCDVFSLERHMGVTLAQFVSMYQYLARLHCDDAPSPDKKAKRELDVKGTSDEADAGTGADDSCLCLRSTDSIQTGDTDVGDSSCGNETKQTADELRDAESTIDIMATITWNNVQEDGPGSITNDLDRYAAAVKPTDTTLCDDPEYLLTIKRLREQRSDDDLLSLLSGSSVISEPVDSRASSLLLKSDTPPASMLRSELTACDDENEQLPEGEDMFSDSSWSELKNVDYDEHYGLRCWDSYDATMENDEMTTTVGDAMLFEEGNDETLLLYEDTSKHDLDPETGEYNDDDDDDGGGGGGGDTTVTVNKDYVVMWAMVYYENGPSANVVDEATVEPIQRPDVESDSTESEFSLLDRVELDERAAVEQQRTNDNDDDDDGKAHSQEQTFDENHYMNVGKESSGDDTSSDLSEFQYSEIDQPSDADSAPSDRMSVGPERSMTEADDSAATDRNQQLWMDDEGGGGSSVRFEFHDMYGEEGEQTAYWGAFGETAGYSDAEKTSGNDLETTPKVGDEESSSSEEVYVPVLPGVGPAIPEQQIKCVVEWVTKCAEQQNGYVHEYNLLHFLCPPLDLKSERCDERRKAAAI